jgi:uncharacterized protein
MSLVSKAGNIKTMESVKAFAQNCFANAHGSHDWDHTHRVHTLCMRIGKIERADMEVLSLAAYLHDVGRSQQDESRGQVCHAERGAAIASEWLTDYPITDEQRSNILNCIRSHRFRGEGCPQTLEARVLFDADKLDAIGAIGIGRAFLFAGEVGARLHIPNVNPEDTRPYSSEDTGYREYRLKLSRIKEKMLTTEGRRIAEDRHIFMEAFFERFLDEYEGLK